MKTAYRLIKLALPLLFALTLADSAWAQFTVTNTFTANTTAVAADVNENFDDIEAEVDSMNLAIIANAGGAATNATAIGGNTTAIAGNATSIGGNTTAIAGNATSIGGNTTAIAGKIDGITAGTGLSGGGTTGTPTITANTSYLQRRVSTSCGVGSSIRAISATGSITCEVDSVGTDTLSALSCTTGEFAKWDGRFWVCSGTTTKRIFINTYGVLLDGSAKFGAGFTTSGSIIFPGAGDPQVNYNFMVPKDHVAGTNLVLEVVWRSTGQNGVVVIRNNWGTRHRIGTTALNFNASTGPGIDTSAFKVETVFVSNNTFSGSSFAAGDYVSHGIFRRDSETDDIVIGGISIRYTGYE